MERTDEIITETLCIINHFEPELYKKIPLKLIEFLELKKSDIYEPNIDFNKSINAQKINRKTRALLAIIYRDYICDINEKNKLIEQDRKYFEKKYEISFKKSTEINNDVDLIKKDKDIIKNDKQIIEYKTSIFKRIINFIKNIFIKKR